LGLGLPLSNEYGTYKTVKARFWSCPRSSDERERDVSAEAHTPRLPPRASFIQVEEENLVGGVDVPLRDPSGFPTGRCRANMAHIRQSRPYSGLGFQVKSCELFELFPLRSEAAGEVLVVARPGSVSGSVSTPS